MLIAGAAPLGVATGLLAWIAANGPASGAEKLRPLQIAAATIIGPPHPSRTIAALQVADLASSPLFLMTVGPGAVTEPSIRLDGLSVTRRRRAALLAIGGAPAEWLAVGETREGVTLRSVAASRVTIETLVSMKDLGLGEESAGSATGAAQEPTTPAQPAVNDAPRGFRLPPPPASAPGRR